MFVCIATRRANRRSRKVPSVASVVRALGSVRVYGPSARCPAFTTSSQSRII